MLLRSPLSSSSPFISPSSSSKPRAPHLYPLLYHSISRPKEVKRGNLPIVSAKISQVHNYGTVDFENKTNLHWSDLYRRILTTMIEDKCVASVLETWDSEERRLSRWTLGRVAKELRKFGHLKEALEVYLWKEAQGNRFFNSSSDMAIQLDLMGKVRGPENAEQLFFSLSDSFKDKRTYCSLLNVYAHYKLKEKAQSTFDLMFEKGYEADALSYNVLMTLYLNIGEHANVVKLMQDMKEKNIALDIYSYNIWISNAAAMQDLDEMENVLNVMESNNVNATWSVYTNLASKYIRLGLMEKAEACLKEAEKRITGRDRRAFLFIISLYGDIGKREELYQIWNWYKSSFNSPLNTGYKAMLQALVKLGDGDGLESLYEEWGRSGSSLDPRVSQVLVGWYCSNGLSDKARETLDQLVQRGGKPNEGMWGTLAEGYMKENRLSEAVSCLEKAVSCGGQVGRRPSNFKWRPRPSFVQDLLEICKQRAQTDIADQVVEIFKREGWDEIEPCKGFVE
ncbi:Pentatricopeptide repeat-containing protein [Rhynchospora pubera]|uniref:Pentatricopeptide repeat-containing protein n=1 Tax=Rhynchospora pubera TaxID=906938 RepID=A0AAV8CX19_9POAL|nr:Pentatricopeptide repeat-containing protein [Rhynchospora pubera]